MVALSDQDFVDLFAAQGVTPTVASLIKAHVDDDMARCILAIIAPFLSTESSFAD
jgi:hypothetical protein